MTLIGIISDVHAEPKAVAEAMTVFASRGVDRILCAGDIAGYMEQLDETIELLLSNHCVTVMGNHDQLYLDKNTDDSDAAAFLKALPLCYEETIAGKRLHMVHAQPVSKKTLGVQQGKQQGGHQNPLHGGIKLLDKTGVIIPERVESWSHELAAFDYDVLIVGHTHQVFVETIAGIVVVNPGSTIFNHCCAILKLPEMTVELIPLGGRDIEKTWNWGEHVIYGHD